ncbi:Uncharacterised protein [BD1-7 clade bacterium]|uniref:GAF domain-containing protein n=1 Tax=BD1-7 clade bacterium TaxID=2029982 RepID=A0A5S9QYV4_9GAMM|nr:Uncharacterised protein [BD1-7 clade bacterium]
MYPAGFRQSCNRVVDEGRQRLGLSMGIVSRIQGEQYEIVAVSSKTGVFVADEAFPLKKTYCREVAETGVTLALNAIDSDSTLHHHPLYQSLPLEAYISAPICLGDNVWGTVNFSCMKPRTTAFSVDDISYVELEAKRLAHMLEAAGFGTEGVSRPH